MNKSSLIEQYFENNLSSEEEIVFNELLANDKEFAEDFHFQKEVKAAIKKEERNKLKKELQDLERFQSGRKKTVFSRKWMAAASIAILLTFLGALFFMKQDSFSNQELYATYFTPYENVIHPIVRGGVENELKTDAFIAYEKNEYKNAIKLFQKAHKEIKDPHLLLYQGISFLAIKEPNKAIKILEQYIFTKPKYNAQANWYLGLSYLQLNNAKEAKKHFKKVSTSSTQFKKEEVKELLKKLP